MSIKVTEKAVRDLVRKLLESEMPAEGQETKIPLPYDGDVMSDLPIHADPVVGQEDLGPPVQNVNYAPEDHEEMQVAAEKLLADVPEDLIPPVFKQLRKLVDKAVRVAKKRAAGPKPNEIVSEGANLLPLIELIVEQVMPYTVDIDAAKGVGYEQDFDQIKMKGEEEEEIEDEEVVAEPQKPAHPPGRKIYAVVPPKSDSSYTGQVDDEEEEEAVDPALAKMIGDAPRVSPREREQQRKGREAQAARSAEQSKVATELAEKAAKEKLEIAKNLYKDDKDLMAKLEELEDPVMLDSVLDTDQVFEVEEEYSSTDTAQQIAAGGARSFDEMSEEQRGKFAEILLDMQKSIFNSAFRNIRDAGFMKFLHGLAMGADKFQEKVLTITQGVPADAAPIQKFLLKALPWSSEFKKEVKKAGGLPEFDPEAASDILKYLSQNEEGAKEGGTLLDDYTSLVHYYVAAQDNFPGSEKSMRKFHFNKENGKAALDLAVKGMIDRGDKESYDILVKVLGSDENRKEVAKQLGKDFQVPKFEIKQEA